MRLAAAGAAAAVEPVFVHLRAHRRHFEDLVALRRASQDDLATTFAPRLRFAVHQPVHLAFVEHGAAVALVPRLRAALALAGPALCPIHAARAVGRRRLGGVVGIQADALFEQLHPFQQLCDDRVAFGHRLRQLRRRQVWRLHPRCAGRLRLHGASIPIKSGTCNAQFK
jgi:hypothetical protein